MKTKIKISACVATQALRTAQQYGVELTSNNLLAALEPHEEDDVVLYEDDNGGAWAGIALLPSGELKGVGNSHPYGSHFPWGTLVFFEDESGWTSVQEITVSREDLGSDVSPFCREVLSGIDAAQAWAELEEVAGTRDVFQIWAVVKAAQKQAAKAAITAEVSQVLGHRTNVKVTPWRYSALTGACLQSSRATARKLFGSEDCRTTAVEVVAGLIVTGLTTWAWALVRALVPTAPPEAPPAWETLEA